MVDLAKTFVMRGLFLLMESVSLFLRHRVVGLFLSCSYALFGWLWGGKFDACSHVLLCGVGDKLCWPYSMLMVTSLVLFSFKGLNFYR